MKSFDFQDKCVKLHNFPSRNSRCAQLLEHEDDDYQAAKKMYTKIDP